MIRLDIPNMDETIRALTAPLQHMPKECESAVSRAINRTLNAMRAEAIRIARRAYVYVPPGRLFDQLYLKKAQRGTTKACLYISGRRGISQYHFRPEPKFPGTKPPAGVSAQIRQGGTRKVYQEPSYSKPFIMKKLRGIDFGGYGVFMRKKGVNNFHKKGRKGAEGLVWKGVKMLFGASPIQSLLKKEPAADRGQGVRGFSPPSATRGQLSDRQTGRIGKNTMRSRELLLAVKEMLTEAMKEYPFPTPDGSCEDLQVFLHGLPDEQGRRTYPFICVRWVSGDINEGVDGYIGAEGRETLALVLGMYAPESQEQAGLILAELLDWTRAVLRRNRVVAKKFQLELPLKASIPDPEKQWMEYHMATVFPEYQYIIPSTPLGGTLKEHTYE